MSIYLKHNNWLVADWVMKKLNRDLMYVNDNKQYDEINQDLNHSEMIYTFLLDYSKIQRKKVESFNSLVSEILVNYELGKLKFDGGAKAFESYKHKLLELHSYILEELDFLNQDA